jgi:predicted ribonuclease toxin of YeeF-YezG toxin-antitoxin module
MNDLDPRIDALYQLPLADFTASRNALAKTLTGDHAKEVRALKKPTLVPWVVNQLFGRARRVYDRVLEKGQALRTAQIAALNGKKADVFAATEAHRRAIVEAVHRATQLAATNGMKPDAELLAQTLAGLSLSANQPSTPGRLIDILQPPGFETLAGVTIAAPAAAAGAHKRETAPSRSATREAEEERKAEQRRQAEARVQEATRDLERARRAESAARKDLDRAAAAVRVAEETLATAREGVE